MSGTSTTLDAMRAPTDISRDDIRFLARPSFGLLHEKPIWRDVPEDADFRATDPAVDGVDLVVDFRLPDDRDVPVPSNWTGQSHWRIDLGVPGWVLTGMVWMGKNPHDELLVGCAGAMFTDPDGFKFAFLLSLDVSVKDTVGSHNRLRRFPMERFATLLPSLRAVFLRSPSVTSLVRRATAHRGPEEPWQREPMQLPEKARGGFNLEGLRDAVKEPQRWLGQTATLGDPIETHLGPLSPSRVLVAWSMAVPTVWGGAADSVQSLDDCADLVAVGMDPAEYATWSLATNEDEERIWSSRDEIVAWFTAVGGGNNRRQVAARMRAGGMTPAQGHLWRHGYRLLGLGKGLAERADTYEAAGWTPEDAERMKTLLCEHVRPPEFINVYSNSRNALLAEQADFLASTTFTHPDRVVAYLQAGYTMTEATELEKSAEPPTDAALQVMAALASPSDSRAAQSGGFW